MHPKAAELVEQDLENPDFSLSNLEKKFDDFARNHRVGNQSIITPAQAETLIREFYGIPSPEENVEKKPMATESRVETQRKVISLFDLI